MSDDFKTQNDELIDPLTTSAILDTEDEIADVVVDDPSTVIENEVPAEEEEDDGFKDDFYNNENEE